MQIQELVSDTASALADEERVSELAFESSRKIVRKTKTAIHEMHLGHRDEALIGSISDDIRSLSELTREHPKIFYGANVESAMSEFAETMIYDRLLFDEDIPSYGDLGITPASWTLGLADSIGELRRDMLSRIVEGDLNGASALFSKMEETSDALMMFDVRDSVAPIRRKQDIARGIMDRSRTDLTTAVVMSGKI